MRTTGGEFSVRAWDYCKLNIGLLIPLVLATIPTCPEPQVSRLMIRGLMMFYLVLSFYFSFLRNFSCFLFQFCTQVLFIYYIF